jgi:diadenylate cyclase
MPELLGSIVRGLNLSTIIDIGITALLIYWLFSLIRGTRAVRLVIGVSVLFVVYALAVSFRMLLLTQILQAGAVVGLFALVVVFQPELRRALERIGRVGSFGWMFSPAESRHAEQVATEVARAAAELSAEGHGALIVLERETGLEEVAETGIMVHGDVSADLLQTIFTPRSALHDGAVIIREDKIVAAGALLPLAETSIHSERFGTRHRAALGITEQTDAVVIVVSEENGQISLVERARIVRNLTEAGLARAIQGFLDPTGGRRGAFGLRTPTGSRAAGIGARRLQSMRRLVGRSQPFRSQAAGAAGATTAAAASSLSPISTASAGMAAGPPSAVPPGDGQDDSGGSSGARTPR